MMFDAYTTPQDEYFEWDDVMENNICAYSHTIPYLPDYQTPTNCYPEVKCLNLGISEKLISSPLDDYYFNWPETSQKTQESDIVVSSLSSQPIHDDLDSKPDQFTSLHPKEEALLPHRQSKPFCDDTFLFPNPTRNVDYLAFDWHKCEDDIWATLRHLRSTKAKYDTEDLTYDRLTNACWRALAVGRLNLKKVDPRDFNWLKDQDMTWLHGPFVSHSSTTQLSNLPIKSDVLPIKSILKKPNLASLLCRGSIPNASQLEKSSSLLFADPGSRTKRKVRFSAELHESVTIEESTDDCTATPLKIHMEETTSSRSTKTLENTDISNREKNVAPVHNLTKASMLHLHHKDEGSVNCNLEDAALSQHLNSINMPESLELYRRERCSNDMAPSICVVRDMMIDTCYRGLGTLQHQPEIYLWPTLTA